MRVLVVAWAWPTHLYPLVPLAWALRAAGHDVVVASQPALMPAVRRTGLPGVVVGPDAAAPAEIADTVRAGGQGRPRPRLALSVRMAEAMTGGLIAACRRRRPDLIIYEPTTYAAPLAAAACGVPAIRHLWGVDIHHAARPYERDAFAPLAAACGATGFDPQGRATVDPCPGRLQIGQHGARGERIALRYVPFNGSGAMPRWLAGRPPRRRICVTWGVAQSHRSGADHASQLRRLTAGLAGLDAELVVAAAPADRAALAGLPGHVRVVELLPLSLLLPTCDLLISRGGNGTLMTGVICGVPQLVVVAQHTEQESAQALARTGAGRALHQDEVTADEVAATAAELLDSAAARDSAAALRREARARPGPGQVAARLERLAAGSRS
jgi:UDP:flavonoid glycosyltransferase YjiC (YdhE family)